MVNIALAVSTQATDKGCREEQGVAEALKRRDITAQVAAWDDLHIRWNEFDLVVVRSVWDYPQRRDEFLGWATSVQRLANNDAVLRWNTDKRYLLSLAEAGIPTVETTVIEPGDEVQFPVGGEFLVKPAYSSGSYDIGRFDASFDQQQRLATAHATRLLERGPILIQPYHSRVDVYGQTGLVYLRGVFSHAFKRHARIDRALASVGSPRSVRIGPRVPLDVEYELADATASAVPAILGITADRLLYARYDMVPGPDGLPVLVGAELTDPTLHLDGLATERFADAIESAAAARPAIGRVPVPRSARELSAA